MINTQILEEIGFSKGEVRVYFALLELGQATIGPISKRAGVTSAKVYIILDKLMSKGLCSNVIKSGTKYFEAANPKKIIEYLDEKNKRIYEEKEEIKKIIPQIELKQKLSEESQTAKVYQSYEGLRTLYSEILEVLHSNKEDFIAFTLGEEEYKNKESEYFFDEFDTKRRALKIKTKLIGNIKQKSFLKEVIKGDKNIEVRYANYETPTGLIIYENRVAILNWQKIPVAFVIQSKQIAETYKKFFMDMWKSAKK